MTRLLQVSFVTLAAIICAGCAAWQSAKYKRAMRELEITWGVRPSKPSP